MQTVNKITKCNLKEDIKIIVMKLMLISNSNSDQELATVLNTNPNTFSSWKNTTKLIPIENLIDFCNKYDVTLDYLLRSNQFLNDFSKNDELIKIPYYKKINSYNFLNNIEDIGTQYIYLNPESIKNKNKNKIFSLLMQDNQLPITAPKDSTLILESSNFSVKPYPELFLIYTEGQTVFKKIYEMLNLQYCLMSENLDVKEEIINPQEIKILGKVVGVLKWS